jgi:hypothetical protein
MTLCLVEFVCPVECVGLIAFRDLIAVIGGSVG